MQQTKSRIGNPVLMPYLVVKHVEGLSVPMCRATTYRTATYFVGLLKREYRGSYEVIWTGGER